MLNPSHWSPVNDNGDSSVNININIIYSDCLPKTEVLTFSADRTEKWTFSYCDLCWCVVNAGCCLVVWSFQRKRIVLQSSNSKSLRSVQKTKLDCGMNKLMSWLPTLHCCVHQTGPYCISTVASAWRCSFIIIVLNQLMTGTREVSYKRYVFDNGFLTLPLDGGWVIPTCRIHCWVVISHPVKF